MHSMTGFGRGTAPMEQGRITLEIRTVNHRFLEVRSRTMKELSGVEPLLERLLRSRLNRGHCTINLTYEGRSNGSTTINTDAISAHIDSLNKIANDKEIALNTLTPILCNAPDLFTLPSFSNHPQLEKAINEAFEEAISNLITMRKKEGSAMAADIQLKIDSLTKTVSNIADLAKNYSLSLFEKTKERLYELLKDSELQTDNSRIETEVAILADKADINEEITRLSSHCNQILAMIKQKKPVGRRIEFLIQEMGREANTIGSKSVDAELTHHVVEFKAELEKIRELVQNVE